MLKDKNSKTRFAVLFCLFILDVAANLLSNAAGWHDVNVTTKALLMPLLCLAGATAISHRQTRLLFILALAFHTAGDILLVFSGQVFFLAGMAAFFIGHLFYFSIIVRSIGNRLSLKESLMITAPSMAIALSVNALFALPVKMAIPVGFYALMLAYLIFTTLAGLCRRENGECKHDTYWWYLFIGFILFTASDSLIAIKSFLGIDFPNRGLLLMALYILAQVLACFGIIRISDQKLLMQSPDNQ